MSVLSEILIYSPLIIFVTTIMNNSNLVPTNLKEENKNKPILEYNDETYNLMSGKDLAFLIF